MKKGDIFYVFFSLRDVHASLYTMRLLWTKPSTYNTHKRSVKHRFEVLQRYTNVTSQVVDAKYSITIEDSNICKDYATRGGNYFFYTTKDEMLKHFDRWIYNLHEVLCRDLVKCADKFT